MWIVVLIMVPLWGIIGYNLLKYKFDSDRNEAVYKIRSDWINSQDPRHEKYTYQEMYQPNKYNKYGWKKLNDGDFRWK